MRLLGRVNRINFVDRSAQDVSVEDVMMADVITLMPAYDFFAPLRPVPVMKDGVQQMASPGVPKIGMTRDHICTGRDFALKPHPVQVKNGAGVICDFISQMHEKDQETARNFITAAAESARQQSEDRDQQMAEASARRAGLVLPGSGRG